jgi:hypothetical protein
MKEFLGNSNPLSPQALSALLDHKEEDLHVDYKESVETSDDKQWIGLSIDVAAFANTDGGYILFGVSDSNFSMVGLPEAQAKIIANTNLVCQKVSRHFRPPFAGLRAKAFKRDGLNFVVWHIPESRGKTHIVVKDAKVRLPSGEEKILLRPGIIYVRRSGTNSIIEPEDLEAILGRRLEHFRESLLEKIAKIVKAPAEHEVLIVDPEGIPGGKNGLVFSNSANAIPVKGLSFSVSPGSDQEEVAAWIALAGRDPDFQPSAKRLWYLLSRHSLVNLSHDSCRALSRFYLMGGLPAFYWIKSLSAEKVQELLLGALSDAKSISVKGSILHVGAFLGKGFFNKLLLKLGDTAARLDLRSRKFPVKAQSFFFPELLGELKGSKATDLSLELSKISGELAVESDYMKATRAKALDCYLYARKDKYKS